MAPALSKISHAIFDMDGLLLDTEIFYTVVSQQIASRYGKEFTWELKAKCMGKKAIESCELMASELGLPLTGAQILEERERGLDALFPTAALKPGAEKLLRHLHAHGVPFALATSSNLRHYELKTSAHRPLFGLFRHRLTGDDVANGKPAPDIFLKAAALFEPRPDPRDCLVFEDAPSGVQAAVAAGMRCVMVPDPRLDRALCTGADQCLDSLEAFDPAAWGLPPY